jgi:hypothetical protein
LERKTKGEPKEKLAALLIASKGIERSVRNATKQILDPARQLFENLPIHDIESPLIPMNEIPEEARKIAVLWVEGYEPNGFDLPSKHKLASDIVSYAISYCNKKLKAKL